MSSRESNSNDARPPAPGKGPGGPVGTAVVTLVLLGALVWAMAPGRGKFTPAPLHPIPPGCPHTVQDFVPSDVTDIPGLDLSSFSETQRNHILFRLNMEPCPCGCNTSIAVCRMNHPACPACADLVKKVLAEETGVRSQK